MYNKIYKFLDKKHYYMFDSVWFSAALFNFVCSIKAD